MQFLISYSVQTAGGSPGFGNITTQSSDDADRLTLKQIKAAERFVSEQVSPGASCVVLYVTPLAEEG
jgi:hypothetical protein